MTHTPKDLQANVLGHIPVGRATSLDTYRQIYNEGLCDQQDIGAPDRQHRTLYTRQKTP